VITKEMKIADVIRNHPETIAVFQKFDLSCRECQIADFEEVEHGAGVHEVDLEKLLAELNRVCEDKD
jgi:hybrid cluster-associated redox disulfide protein